ncbi:ferrous iron transport protein B [Crocosphaera sp. Alani8]|uniref:ferrous iron transport protein B n=1 Tax=Crocosphaera sp. Alani8 TaxID=3038952 RepID=UPI00313DDBC2
MTASTRTGAIISAHQNTIKRIGFIGQPNTGKSTFFNRITNAGAGVANWPGLTVDLLQATIEIHGHQVEFVDLPGIYDLDGFTEDERVVQKFLEEFAIDLIVVVINATQIDRQIRMPLQVKSLGLPAVVVLNMADEAKRYGVQIDCVELSDRLESPVYTISAKYGTGCAVAINGITRTIEEQPHTYQVQGLVEHLESAPVTEEYMESILEGAVQMPSVTSVTFTNRLDKWLLHPIWGLPIFFFVMFLVFWFLWSIGIPTADPVDAATGWFQERILEPVISPFPTELQDFIINGPWNGFATVLSFVPLVALFFVAMSALEDSGYLSRSAYLMDSLMSRVGLDGRGFVLQMMGFGCNVPAIMGTRVMRSRAMRLLSMLIIPLALCSARLQVFVFILAAIFPNQGGAVALFALYVISFLVAFVVAGILSLSGQFKSRDPFVLELPPYRLPTIKQVLLNVWGEMKQFVSKVTVFMIIGASLIWILTALPPGAEGLDTLAGQLGKFFSPIMDPIGINPFLTVSLIFGFVAKEVQLAGLAVIYGLSNDALGIKLSQDLTFAQGFSYCLFSLLYIPCLTTLSTIWGESKSLKFTIFSVVFSLGTAWVVSFIFYQGANLFS